MSYRATMLCIAAVALVLVLDAGAAPAEVVSETIEYQQNGQTLEGVLVYDDAVSGPRPGVVIFHAWYGPGEHEKETAVRLAELGYAAFVADVYGTGVRAADSKEASQLATTFYDDRDLMQARALAAVETLGGRDVADPERMFGIGYCFGGAVVLESARAGADLLGVVSIHGTLRTPHPEAMSNFQGSVLALHGAADPVVPPEEVRAFQDELTEAGVDWVFISYGGAVHSFTHESADSEASRYHPLAAKRAWRDMLAFFDERLEHAGGK
ncbi:dienelactone hydrolase family protein [Oceanidesulfovibrio indonesiensis]|nr:dienelactone hydrolase family protein [Oceanidesulfovibrio indonesiensis]